MYIGIDIGGTNIKSGVVDSSGNILLGNSFKTGTSEGPTANLMQIKKSIFEMINKFPSIQSIGIGVPGIIDKSGVLNVSPNLPEWHGINIHDELKKDFNLTIAVDNDANAAAIAEMETGAGKDTENFIYITLGTGIGGALIINKKIYRGCEGGAGEIGHTIINYDLIRKGIPTFRQGILEELAGRKAIITYYQLLMTNDNFSSQQTADGKLDLITNYKLRITNYKLRITNEDLDSQNDILGIDSLDVEDIANSAKSGFQPAVDCLNETGEIIGIGLASAMNLLDIPVAIIGGGISQSGKILFDSIRKTIRERSLPTISERFEIREAYFKNNTGIIGAAMLGANKMREQS
ncbi:MAG: ROK family protein [bacterium]